MAKLKTLQWWPRTWLSNGGSAHTAEEVRKHGVLNNVRRSMDTLTLIADCNGAICTAVARNTREKCVAGGSTFLQIKAG
jgi:hypothetical protein